MILRKRIKKRIVRSLSKPNEIPGTMLFCVRARSFWTLEHSELVRQRFKDTPVAHRGFYGSLGA